MRTALALITALCVTSGLAACGGSGAPGGGGTATSAKADFATLLKFSQCMRAHGLPNFPDPGAGGGLQFTPSSGMNPQSPAVQAAQKACRKLMPGGGPGGPIKATHAQFVAALAFARELAPVHARPRRAALSRSGVVHPGRVGPDHLPARDDVQARAGDGPAVAGVPAGRLPLWDPAAAATQLTRAGGRRQPPITCRQWPISPSYSTERVISRYSASVTASRLCPGAQ